MKGYHKNKKTFYLNSWSINKLYGWEVSQRLPGYGFKWDQNTSKFNEDFIEYYNEDSDGDYFLKVHNQYPENLHSLHNDLSFLPERMNIENVEELVSYFHNEKGYTMLIRTLKQALNHGLVLKKVHGAIQFNQETLLKLCIEERAKEKNAKNNFKKHFFKITNDTVFGKTIKNMRKHRNIKLASAKAKETKL